MKKILVVDDEALLVKGIRFNLQNDGYEVITGSDGVEAVDTISGATKTTAAYKNAMKDALNAAIILGGGEVDIRTEEEILNDNLSAALPDDVAHHLYVTSAGSVHVAKSAESVELKKVIESHCRN